MKGIVPGHRDLNHRGVKGLGRKPLVEQGVEPPPRPPRPFYNLRRKYMYIHGVISESFLSMEWLKKVGKVPEVRERHASTGFWRTPPLMRESEGLVRSGKRQNLNRVGRHDDAKGSQLGL